MLRELHEVLLEMQASVTPLALASDAGMRLQSVHLTLPLDMVTVFRGGGCTLLADVPRSHSDTNWRSLATRLNLTLAAEPQHE
jgi:hypothetical protein